MKATTNVAADAVNFQNRHILYVEGGGQSIDVEVLKPFFDNILAVQPLCQASSIRSVAESLYPTHPTYYFLIDRDHHLEDNYVETCWKNFPDPEKSNLLIWRRKELENYFLEPSLLIKSNFCKKEYKEDNGRGLQEKIVSLSQERLYLDVVNYVIVSLREDFKQNWIEKFSNPSDFPDETSALTWLTNMQELKDFSEKVLQQTTEQEITVRFRNFLDQMTGGEETLQWGIGKWLSMISGKSIFHTLVNLCFQVTNQQGKIFQGKEAINLVARDLLQTGENLPSDILDLRELIRAQVNSYQGSIA